MTSTTTRLLRLLSLLQNGTHTGRDLAERLAVTDRTLRQDIARLRELGYPVHAERGPVGGYRLGQGTTMPPLLLDDEEAVAIAVAMGLTAKGSTGVADMDVTLTRALAKMERILPKRLQRKVTALRTATDVGPAVIGSREPEAPVPAETLATIATAIRAAVTLRVDGVEYEPYRLISATRRWFLVAYSLHTHTWRALPVASVEQLDRSDRPFAPRPLPQQDLVGFVLREVSLSGWKVHAEVTVLQSAATVIARINPAVGIVEPLTENTCRLLTGADALETIAIYLSMLMMDFRVDGPPELVAHLRTLARRYSESTPAQR
ncbi:WYL domain-containing protein [Nocardia sp. NPDC005978]|uniref:helix-turn-helix transcriptional regulator n=1 Tax=unclassified Nocardia TaxID=2637762 RepID=UPI0033AAA318